MVLTSLEKALTTEFAKFSGPSLISTKLTTSGETSGETSLHWYLLFTYTHLSQKLYLWILVDIFSSHPKRLFIFSSIKWHLLSKWKLCGWWDTDPHWQTSDLLPYIDDQVPAKSIKRTYARVSWCSLKVNILGGNGQNAFLRFSCSRNGNF